MQVEIRIDGAYPEPKVVILTAAVTEEVSPAGEKTVRRCALHPFRHEGR